MQSHTLTVFVNDTLATFVWE